MLVSLLTNSKKLEANSSRIMADSDSKQLVYNPCCSPPLFILNFKAIMWINVAIVVIYCLP
jgi:hypothetical protein